MGTLKVLCHDITTSCSLLWGETTSPLHLQVIAWWPSRPRAFSGHRGQRELNKLSTPSYHLMATWNWETKTLRQKTESHEAAWGEETNSRRALSAMEDMPRRTLKRWLSSLEERLFWETGDKRITSEPDGGIEESTHFSERKSTFCWWNWWEFEAQVSAF